MNFPHFLNNFFLLFQINDNFNESGDVSIGRYLNSSERKGRRFVKYKKKMKISIEFGENAKERRFPLGEITFQVFLLTSQNSLKLSFYIKLLRKCRKFTETG